MQTVTEVLVTQSNIYLMSWSISSLFMGIFLTVICVLESYIYTFSVCLRLAKSIML